MKGWLKKKAVLLMALLMVVTFMPAGIFTAYADESTTLKQDAQGYFEINSASEMKAFAEEVSKNNAAKGKLMKDIDMSEIDVASWKPIGNETKNYQGEFDGNGKSIKNFNADLSKDKLGLGNLQSTIYTNAGIFGFVGDKASVKNIKDITGTMKSSVQKGTGAVAGTCQGVIENCKSSLNIEFKDDEDTKAASIGGIVGEISGISTVSKCGFDGNIKVTDDNFQLGGVCGNIATGDLFSCCNRGEVFGIATGTRSDSGKIGGVIGRGPGFKKQVRYCYNAGTVKGEGEKASVGSIIGFSNVLSDLSNSFSAKEVSGNTGTLGNSFVGNMNSKRHVEIAESVLHTAPADDTAITMEDLNSDSTVNTKLNSADDGLAAELKFVKGKTYPVLKWEKGEETAPEPEKVPVTKVQIQRVSQGVLKASVTGKGGKEATDVKYQWQKCTSWDDVMDPENPEVEYEDIPGETKDTLTITKDIKSRFSQYQVIVTDCDGKKHYAEKENFSEVAPEDTPGESSDAKYLSEAAEKCSGLPLVLNMKFGEDKNVNSAMESYIKKLKDSSGKNFEGITTTVAKVEKSGSIEPGEAAVAQDGTITYFFADPFKINEKPYYNRPYGQFEITFDLHKGKEVKQAKKKFNVLWNIDKLVDSLQKGVLDKLTFDNIKGSNDSKDTIKTDLELIRYFGGKNAEQKLAKIEWKSGDSNIIKIEEPTGDTDTVVYGPLIGKVKRSKEDKEVTLTATVKYAKTNDGNKKEDEAVAKLKKEFKLTVKGTQKTSEDLQKALENALEKKGVRDFCTGEKADLEHVKGSLKFPTTRDIGIDGKYSPVTIDSDDHDVAEPWFKLNSTELQPNAATLKIYRPLPGKEAKKVNITITINDTQSGAEAKKVIPVTVEPLTEAEIEDAKDLMSIAKYSYYEGFAGENKNKFDITSNLRPYQEITKEGYKAKYIYDHKERTWAGIGLDTKVENPGKEGVGSPGYSDSNYSRFFSSKPNLIADDVLTLAEKKPEYDTTVTISSVLTHEIYGKYFVKARAKGDEKAMELFKELYRQPVSDTVKIRGEKGEDPDPAKNIRVFFTLNGPDGKAWIKKVEKVVPKESFAGEVLERVFKENGYSYIGSLSYISGVKKPDGETLSQKDMGSNSGWMYRVNGVIAGTSLDKCEVKDGDEIEFFYTRDWQKEPKVKENENPDTPGNPDQKYIKKLVVKKLAAKVDSKKIRVSFAKVKEANNYIVYFKKYNAKTWKSKSTKGKNNITLSGFKNKDLIQIRCVAVRGKVKGKYSGIKYCYIARTKFTAAKAKKSAVLKIKKFKGAAGYEVRYSMNKSMKSAKTVKVNKLKFTLKKLKSKKTYYVTVTPYKKSHGKVYYGQPSGKKSVKIG